MTIATYRTGTATVVRIHVSAQGGVPKLPVARAEVTYHGLMGDAQRDHRRHGGPERAVSLYADERIRQLRAEGHPIDLGTTGENLTVRGLDWASMQPGDVLLVGNRVQLEITAYATPCTTIAASFQAGDFMRIAHARHPGWSRLYARVLIEGPVCTGDTVVPAIAFG